MVNNHPPTLSIKSAYKYAILFLHIHISPCLQQLLNRISFAGLGCASPLGEITSCFLYDDSKLLWLRIKHEPDVIGHGLRIHSGLKACQVHLFAFRERDFHQLLTNLLDFLVLMEIRYPTLHYDQSPALASYCSLYAGFNVILGIRLFEDMSIKYQSLSRKVRRGHRAFRAHIEGDPDNHFPEANSRGPRRRPLPGCSPHSAPG